MHTIDFLAEVSKRIEQKLASGATAGLDALARETAVEVRTEEGAR